MSSTVTIHINGKAVEAVRDGDKLVIEVAGRKVRIPMDAKGVLSVPKQGRPTLESAQPEPTEAMVDATKLRAVREAAKRPATPKNQRETYLRARHAAAVRDAHTMGFRCGFAEGQSKLLGAPLADRITDADADQLLELVMQVVLDNEELRAGYRMACDLVDGDDVGSVDVVAPPAPVEPSPVAPLVEPTIADLIASIDEAVGEQVSFATETVIEPTPMVELPEAPFVAPAATQAAPSASPKPAQPRAAWVGTMSFGMTVMNVKLHSTHRDEHGIDMFSAHETDGGRIRYAKICTCCDTEVSAEDVGRARKSDGVCLSNNEFKALDADAIKDIGITEFVNAADVDVALLEQHYQLVPGKNAERAYGALAEALRTQEKVAVARIVLRSTERVAVVRVTDGRLSLSLLRWADQMKQAVDIAPAVFTDQELQQAMDVVATMTTKFQHDKLADPREAALTEAFDRKL